MMSDSDPEVRPDPDPMILPFVNNRSSDDTLTPEQVEELLARAGESNRDPDDPLTGDFELDGSFAESDSTGESETSAPVSPPNPEGLSFPVVASPERRDDLDAVTETAETTIADLLEVRCKSRHRIGRRSLIGFRAAPSAAEKPARFHLRVEGESLGEPMTLTGELTNVSPVELGTISWTPTGSGTEILRLTLTRYDADGLPTDRWWGRLPLETERGTESNAAGSLPAPDLHAEGGAEWQPTPVIADRLFREELDRFCPETDSPNSLPDVGEPLPDSASGLGILYLHDIAGGDLIAKGIRIGRELTVGRGGDPAVHFWLAPEPYDSGETTRLSRSHAAITFRADRAFVTDRSTNGTFLTGDRLTKGEPAPIPDGDELSLATTVRLKVNLFGDGESVTAVGLRRRDALAHRLGYLFFRPDAIVPVSVGTIEPLWLTWRVDDENTPILAVQLPGKTDWTPLRSGDERILDGTVQIAWHQLPHPVEQDRFFS